MKPHNILIITIITAVSLSATAHADLYQWDASSGLFPDQVTPSMTLFDNATPENPQLGAGILTLSTSDNLEVMRYLNTASELAMPGLLQIEARLRFVSGSNSSTSRAPATIVFTIGPNNGNALFIGPDEVFLNIADSTRGPSAAVDTDNAFHTYRIDINTATGVTDVFYDSAPLISGATFVSSPFNGPDQRIIFGNGTIIESGVSEWQTFSHNAAVPEPSAIALAFAGAIIGLLQRRRRA